MFIVKNIKDGRIVFKHKLFDRYYVNDTFHIYDDTNNLEIFKTKDLKEAYNILEATRFNWGGNDWRIISVSEQMRDCFIRRI